MSLCVYSRYITHRHQHLKTKWIHHEFSGGTRSKRIAKLNKCIRIRRSVMPYMVWNWVSFTECDWSKCTFQLKAIFLIWDKFKFNTLRIFGLLLMLFAKWKRQLNEVVSMLMELILDSAKKSRIEWRKERKIEKRNDCAWNPASKQFKCCLLLNVIFSSNLYLKWCWSAPQDKSSVRHKRI